ncbi:MAG: ankyrin repeat domain-containing protein [Bdellovibrionaceae bacterium]|nr:ankyrin repeat domain-containing protein [Pseudobdellovibrionaceae bacterium]
MIRFFVRTIFISGVALFAIGLSASQASARTLCEAVQDKNPSFSEIKGIVDAGGDVNSNCAYKFPGSFSKGLDRFNGSAIGMLYLLVSPNQFTNSNDRQNIVSFLILRGIDLSALNQVVTRHHEVQNYTNLSILAARAKPAVLNQALATQPNVDTLVDDVAAIFYSLNPESLYSQYWDYWLPLNDSEKWQRIGLLLDAGAKQLTFAKTKSTVLGAAIGSCEGVPAVCPPETLVREIISSWDFNADGVFSLEEYIMRSIRYNNLLTLQELQARGGDLSHLVVDGKVLNALEYLAATGIASDSHNLAMSKYLLSQGMNANDNFGFALQHTWSNCDRTVAGGCAGFVQLLLDHGANPNLYDTSEKDLRNAALPWAAQAGDLESVQILVQAGADINHVNAVYDPIPSGSRYKDGTAIYWALARGHGDVVKFLLKSGANPNVKGVYKESATPYCYAKLNVHNESFGFGYFANMADLLRQYGATANCGH